MQSRNQTRHTPRPAQIEKMVRRTAFRLKQDDVSWQEAFTQAVMAANSSKPAAIWCKPKEAASNLPENLPALAWQPDWVEVFKDTDTSIGKHTLHESGHLYSLDFSSVVSASSLLTITEPIETILDMCAAPGGKALFAWRAFNPELLVCNEVIYKRHAMLHANLNRTGASEVAEVVQRDPDSLSKQYPNFADIVLVDAPCSGQSLLAKGDEAEGAFLDHVVAANMTRQRRILANAVKIVRPGGYLCYMTCTYAREENEKNVEWLLRRFPEFTAQIVPHLEEAGIRSWLLDEPCYRHSPQDGLGAGGFVALLRRSTEPVD